jgi:putative Mg2+ transporter-C (MgtC) family protein
MGLATLLLVPLRATASTVAVVEPIAVVAATTEVASTVAAVMIAAPPVSAAVEMQLSIRLVYAALMGAILGKERSLAKHSAGVRTMALVAMGASAFTVCSAYGFANFGHYDPSRMASNVASGVGFVGAGVITTTANRKQNVVHGLTTAVTIWLSAAVGVACGVGLFRIATTAVLTTIGILRLGRSEPKHRKKTKSTTAVSEVLEKVDEMSAAKDPAAEMMMEEEEEEEDDYAEIHDTSVWDEQPNIQKNSTESQQPPVPRKQRMTYDGDHGMQVVVEKAWRNNTQEA